MPIPKNINTEHVIRAIKKVEMEGVPEKRESTRYHLYYENKLYPPKYIISLANLFANGVEYSSKLFSGGDESNNFLRSLGFNIVENGFYNTSGSTNNTWIFQGNPRVFDINNYVKDHKYIWWSLRQGHFIDKIQLNDLVFLWRSDGGNKGSGGILAKCKIVSFPLDRTDDHDARDYWHTDDWTESYLAVKLEVLEVKLSEGFISRLSLLENSKLKDLLILRLRQQTNYLLTHEQSNEIEKLWNSPYRDEYQYGDLITEINSIYEIELIETEREQIAKARIGQSAFKKNLLKIDSKCRLCGVSDSRFLIASHIKPWSHSNHQERLNINNGLLLCPNHDTLFDRGLISFDSDGSILLSDSLEEATKIFMNISETMRIELNKEQQSFIEWHRLNIYNKF